MVLPFTSDHQEQGALRLVEDLLQLVESDTYQDHVDGFMQQHCDQFCRQPGQTGAEDDCNKCEQSFEEHEIFTSYCKLIESQLNEFLETHAITQKELMDAIQRSNAYKRTDDTGRRLRALVNSFEYSGFLNTILQYSDAGYNSDNEAVKNPANYGLDPTADIVNDLLGHVDSDGYQSKIDGFMAEHEDLFGRRHAGQKGGHKDIMKSEQSLDQHEVYTKYQSLVEELLENFLKERGVSQEDLMEKLKSEKVNDKNDMQGARMRHLMASLEFDEFLVMMNDYANDR